MLTLTTPITIPNINKVDPHKVIDDRDEAVPSFTLLVRVQAVGGRDAGTFSVVARNAANSQRMHKNAAPATLSDSILTGAAQIDNACTQIGDAYDAAAGNRAAKRVAAYAKAVEIGLIDPLLAAT
jgi:hypothetical protein